jgi:predicted nuclease with RNAse H fold
MLFTDSVFIGIDPTSAHQSFTYAALDKGMNLLALSAGELDDAAAFVGGQSHAVVAVNSPSGLNRGLAREKSREMFKSLKTRALGFRLAELELRERGISVTGTPSTLAACPAWIQSGFTLYRKLEKMGFKKYPAENHAHQTLETHAHAAFCVLAGAAPLPRQSMEGKIQRQLLLFEAGMRIKDPMDFFEEITRHKMLKGSWPLELLYPPEQLDALAAAHTAWLAFHKPELISMLGDAKEGMIVLPEKNLKEKYERMVK